MKKNFFSFLLWGFILLSYISSLGLAKVDINFSFRWLSFWLWFSTVVILFSYLVLNKIKNHQTVFKQDLLLPIVLFLSLCLNFLLLKAYPFVAVLDEIRDGGLNARQILEGSIINIHGYGRYESHGLIIPTLISPFYLFFKDSVLSYRFPAACLATLDILLIYFLAKQAFSKTTAFFAALILLCFPLHLYYGRTEVVVIFSSLLTSLILFCFYFLIKNKSLENYILIGLVLGFSSGFHASVRTIVLITLMLTVISTTLSFFKKNGKKSLLGLLFMVVFFFIGFGPRLFFTPLKIFFHFSSIPLLENHATISSISLSNTTARRYYKDLGRRYFDSLGAYFKYPVTFHYRDGKPILLPILGVFFIIGIGYLLLSPQNRPIRYLVAYAFLIPATNSALTNCLNCDHRLIPVLPVTALITAAGISFSISMISGLFMNKRIKFLMATFLITILVLYTLFNGYNFFAKESASRGKTMQDFLSMYTVYLIKSFPSPKKVCLVFSPQNSEFFNFMHINEQYEFFLKNTVVEKAVSPRISENEIYILKDCNFHDKELWQYEYCRKKEKFVCPPEYEKSLRFYVDGALL